MPATNVFPMQGLQPAHSQLQATKRAVRLPRGGPTLTGGPFAQGTGVMNVGGTAQKEVWTITTTGPDNTFTVLFIADRVYSTGPLPFNVSTAALKLALETNIFGKGGILTVTGTPGSSYVITHGVNVRIGGHVFFTNTFGSGAISLVRTTRGSCGPGQFDVSDAAVNTSIDRILLYQHDSDPSGSRATESGCAVNQEVSPPAYNDGYFFCADIPNLFAAAVGNGKKLAFDIGTAITDAGAIVKLTQNL